MANKNLIKAFGKLRKLGYVAKRNFLCCSTCATYELSVNYDNPKKYVFIHQQGEECLRETGSAYLQWSGDGREIFDVMLECGLRPEWDGSDTKTIRVWK